MTPALFLHPAAPLDLTRPSIHWSTVAGLLLLGALYWWRARVGERNAPDARDARKGGSADTGAAGAGRAAPTRSWQLVLRVVQPGPRPASPRPAGFQQFCFAVALVVIFLSLNGPIHDLSDYYLFSAHMVQHLLLTLVAAPLMVYGTTGEMLRPLIRNARVFAVARALTKPPICYAIFNVVIIFWHLPFAYNAAMADHGIHIVQHLTLMAASVLMWWPLMSPLPELPRLSYPGQMLYCFLMVVPMSVVAIYIAMADTILYPAYATAPRMWGITPMLDQHIGGLIMWIPGGLFFYGIMTIVFFRWAGRGEDTREAAQVGYVARPG